jgi:hypothetical protein
MCMRVYYIYSGYKVGAADTLHCAPSRAEWMLCGHFLSGWGTGFGEGMRGWVMDSVIFLLDDDAALPPVCALASLAREAVVRLPTHPPTYLWRGGARQGGMGGCGTSPGYSASSCW